MNTVQSTTQPDSSTLRKPSIEPSLGPSNRKNDQPPAKSSRPSKLSQFAFASYLLMLLIGVAITLAWQTYGDAARHLIASAAFSLDQQQFKTISVDLDAMRQSIDKLASSIADNHEKATRIADDQERIMRSIDQVIAGQVQITREIDKARALDQFITYKSSDPPPRPASAPAPKPALRPTQAPTSLTPAKNP